MAAKSSASGIAAAGVGKEFKEFKEFEERWSSGVQEWWSGEVFD
jgi:hypothetical protein